MNKSTKFLGCGLLALGLFVACGGDDTPAGGSGGAGGSSGAKASGGGPGSSDGGAGGGQSEGGLADPIHVVPGSTEASPDGSEAHPFASLHRAVDAIVADTSWDGKVIVHEGRLELTAAEGDLVLPKRADLEVRAGATFAMGYLVAIHAQRHVEVLGTAEKQVVFTWLDEGQHWGGFTLFEPTSTGNVFEYATFEHGYEVQFNGLGMRGALSLYGAGARISHCTFQENEGDDGLGTKNNKVILEYSTFLDNFGDGVDADQNQGSEIRFNYFEGGVNDAVDMGEGSDAHIHDNIMINSGDKAISSGEASTLLIEHNLMVGCHIGIGDKDGSMLTVMNNTLYGNEIGIAAYEAAAGYGAGKGTFTSNIVWGSTVNDLDLDPESEATFAYSCIENLKRRDPDTLVLTDEDHTDLNGSVADGDGILSKGTGCDDPMFADPDTMDFHLQSEAGRYDPQTKQWVTDDASSPGIDGGDPDADVGDEPEPNGARVDMGLYGGTSEASKSP